MAAPYKVEIDGTEHEFPYLTPQDRIAFTEDGFKMRRAALAANLEDAGYEPDYRFERLEEFELARGSDRSLFELMRRPAGAKRIVAASLARLNGSAVDVETIDANTMMEVAWKICGFPDPDDIEQTEDDDDADPSKSAEAATGTSKPD